MSSVENQLEKELRQVVVEHVTRDAHAVEEIADGMGVSVASVNELLKQSRWQLELTIQILDQLDVRVRVVAA